MNKNYRTYKDYRGETTQDQCRVFKCTCDSIIYYVVSERGDMAIELLKKYKKGKSYSAKFTGRYYISMIENEECAIFTEKQWKDISI